MMKSRFTLSKHLTSYFIVILLLAIVFLVFQVAAAAQPDHEQEKSEPFSQEEPFEHNRPNHPEKQPWLVKPIDLTQLARIDNGHEPNDTLANASSKALDDNFCLHNCTSAANK